MPDIKTAPADLDSHAKTQAEPRRVHEAEVVREPQTFAEAVAEVKAEITREMGGKKPHKDRPALTLGNIVHFLIGVFFLWPIFLFVGAVSSIGHVVAFIRSSLEAMLSTLLWLGMLAKESSSRLFLHKDDPKMLQLKGSRRAFWHEAARDWTNAGKALVGIGRRFSGIFGLGGLFAAFEQRIQRAGADWRRYVIASTPVGATPGDFPDNYVIVDQLPPGGSSARLYIVRKKAEDGSVDQNGPLFVLKYFDLMQGGNLESVVRESQAADLAKKLGLIIESNLGTRAFWYVMPYYHGSTLTMATLDGVKEARKNGTRAVSEQQRMALGWLHQVLQIIAQYHEAGVFHKDIKPDNLIVNGERIYLVDIGLMTPLSSMHQLTTHGTEYFRDPEMVKLALEGREVRQVNASKFDIYSIGAVLYFAIEGEFPTSGPLSRFSSDVPLAVQWVANRAMAGMNQRYETARQMLTDVDYLCWAAAQGALDQVKPADLPSFRGMPVPSHLMPPAQVQAAGYGQRRHFSQGGYGSWYMAPAFKPQGRHVGWRIGAIVGGIGALVFVGLLLSGKGIWPFDHESRHSIAARLPEPRKELAPLYDRIEKQLRERGVGRESERHSNPVARTELVPEIVKLISDRTSDKLRSINKIRIGGGNPAPTSTAKPGSIIFIATGDAPAGAIEYEFGLEAERAWPAALAAMTAEQRESLLQVINSLSDVTALHRELASRFAAEGKAPPLVVLAEFTRVEDAALLDLRMISPGYEWRDVFVLARE